MFVPDKWVSEESDLTWVRTLDKSPHISGRRPRQMPVSVSFHRRISSFSLHLLSQFQLPRIWLLFLFLALWGWWLVMLPARFRVYFIPTCFPWTFFLIYKFTGGSHTPTTPSGKLYQSSVLVRLPDQPLWGSTCFSGMETRSFVAESIVLKWRLELRRP